MKDRLKEFMDYKKLTAADLADTIGVQRSNVSHILNGRNNPGAQFLEKLLMAYPDLDANWLLTGRGAMLSGVSGDRSSRAAASPSPSSEPLPFPAPSPVKTAFPSPESSPPPASSSASAVSRSGAAVPSHSGAASSLLADPPAPKSDPPFAGATSRIIIFHDDRSFTEYFPR